MRKVKRNLLYKSMLRHAQTPITGAANFGITSINANPQYIELAAEFMHHRDSEAQRREHTEIQRIQHFVSVTT